MKLYIPCDDCPHDEDGPTCERCDYDRLSDIEAAGDNVRRVWKKLLEADETDR